MVKSSTARAAALTLNFLSVGLILLHAAADAHPAATEYEIKAVYLFNFARFVTWPDSAFPSPEAPITLCVLGNDPFGSVLDRTLANESVAGRPLAARRIAGPEAATDCQLVFVDTSASTTTSRLLHALRGQPVLTVGDDEAFAHAGGMVGFYLEDATVRLAVNEASVRAAGLSMSAQLLRIVRLVAGAP